MKIDDEKLKLYTVIAREQLERSGKIQGAPIMHGVIIRRYRLPFPSGDCECLYQNEGFSTEQFLKKKWYFRYRGAIEQIKTPRQAIEVFFYQYPHISPDRVLVKIYRDRLRAAKSKASQIQGAMTRARDAWRELFPIEETEDWKTAETKLLEKQAMIVALEQEIEKLNQP